MIVELRRAAAGRHVRRLWLPPLEAHPTVDGLHRRYPDARKDDAPWELDPIIGEPDDPARQEKRLLTLPLSREGNAVVYGAVGSGAEGVLQSMLYDLCVDHSADELNAYVIDMGSGTLAAFSEAPQVGGVLQGTNEDGVRRLFDMLCSAINERRELLAPYGGSLERMHEAGKSMPPPTCGLRREV